MNDREAALHFYEAMTGVFNDKKSKVTRYICFAVLFGGMIWAGLNYFRTAKIADIQTPLTQTRTQTAAADPAVQKIIDLAKTVNTMRSAGTSIAAALGGHSSPFNLDPVIVESTPLIPDELIPDDTPIPPAPAPAPVPVQIPADKPREIIPLTVRMVMTANDGQRIAVIDIDKKDSGDKKSAPDKNKGLIIRTGDEIPEVGVVRAIRTDGITVMIGNKEEKYKVPEIPIYTEIKAPKKKKY